MLKQFFPSSRTCLSRWYNSSLPLLKSRGDAGVRISQCIVFCIFFFHLTLCFSNDNSQLYKDAGNGDREAQYTLAHLYLKGRGGLAIDVGSAISWFRKSAHQGHRDAAFDLALLYLEGTVVEKSREKALQWIGKAADNGHTEAQYILGLAHKKTDLTTSVYWLKKAEHLGHIKAAAELKELCETYPGICD